MSDIERISGVYKANLVIDEKDALITNVKEFRRIDKYFILPDLFEYGSLEWQINSVNIIEGFSNKANDPLFKHIFLYEFPDIKFPNGAVSFNYIYIDNFKVDIPNYLFTLAYNIYKRNRMTIVKPDKLNNLGLW